MKAQNSAIMFYTKEPMLNKPDADLQKQRTNKRVQQALALNAVIILQAHKNIC